MSYEPKPMVQYVGMPYAPGTEVEITIRCLVGDIVAWQIEQERKPLPPITIDSHKHVGDILDLRPNYRVRLDVLVRNGVGHVRVVAVTSGPNAEADEPVYRVAP